MTGFSDISLNISQINAQDQKREPFEQNKETPCFATTPHPDKTLNIESLIDDLFRQSVEDDVSGSMRKLGIMFRDLCVRGLDVGTAVQHDLASLFYPYSIMRYISILRHPPVRDLISGFEGVVHPGEMLLVLGRPGSGCSTFLKTLANYHEEYHSVLGDVFYDSFFPKEIHKRYRGDVIYCPEDDIHFPTLTVRETLEFSCMMKAPSCRASNQSKETYATHMAELLMRIFGLEHVRDTVVGDAYLRGTSGGEKKRVSIAEVMSARGKLVCWDNSTRGLDSSTALEFIQALRVTTDVAKVTTIVSIYQAGEQLFELFDKVCVIYEGKMAYFGLAKDAKQYFMDMGYEPQNRQTTPDFLVASTDPNGRKFCPEFEGAIPRTADEMAAYFKASLYGQLNRSSIESYHNLYVNKPDLKVAYNASVMSERDQHAPKSQPYTLSTLMQVRTVMRRRWQIIKGEWLTQAVQVGSQVFQALLIGTVFLRMDNNTSTYFSRGSVLYFSLFCGSISSMTEIPGLFSQRLIVLRHQRGALYYPFIEALAHTIVDIPISFISVAVMAIILYFLVGLQQTLEQFLFFFLFIFTVTLVMKASFRIVASSCRSESTAVAVAGVMVLILVLCMGYVIPVRNIFVALRWVQYLNPLQYAFKSLIINEFRTIDGTCTTLVPSGPGYEDIMLANKVCTTVGSQPGFATVSGAAYIYLSFGYSCSGPWRNLGVLCLTFLASLVYLLFRTQHSKRTRWNTAVMHYREGYGHAPARQVVDEENVTPGNFREVNKFDAVDNNIVDIFVSDKPRHIFSWKNLRYEVPVARGETRTLLDGVSGYVAPGKLTALMGESGAGKTILLNVLAQRVSVGVVGGSCLVNGRPLPTDFAAQTAYVQQMDTHIPESTVREALLFSARLRQPASVPMAEKEAYVDKCLRVCGLEAQADAIVGTLGVEHKKRTTIGVELAAKPKLLLFLDEPTSGLDSQSAWAIVKFLRELADHGQAILCTIHQPSGELFQVFDRLLLLQKGGQTVYFGDIGEKSTTMIEYFQRNGAPPCPAEANPAEYVLDVIGAGATATCATDWNRVWRDSAESASLDVEIERIHGKGQSHPDVSTGQHSEFASSWIKQLTLLTHRGFVCYWRSPTYIYSKLLICIVAGLLIGFAFFGTSNSLHGCQDKLFSVFMVAALCVPMPQHLQGKFIESRTVYEIRERPSRMFTWSAFLLSQILIEIPWNVLSMSLLFVCWYWTSGFNSSRAGISYLFYCVVFPIYYVTFGQAAAVISPNGVIASTLSTALFSFVIVFAGVLQRYSELGWWKWMYYLSPITYLIDGLLGQAIGKQLITCTSTEFVTIDPPSGMTCGAYMNPYISFAGGYLTNPNSTAKCEFCPFRTTDEYVQTNFGVSYGHHWRDLVVLLGFAVFNVLFMFAGMYFFRIHKRIGGLKHSPTKTK